MATLCSLFQQPGTALLIGLLVVLDPWIWNLAAVVLELLPPFPSHLQPTAWSVSAHRTHKHALATCESAYASPILDILASAVDFGSTRSCCSQPAQPVALQAALSSKEEPAGVPAAGRASLGLDSLNLAMWGSL